MQMARTDFELCLLLRVSMSYAKIRPCHFHRSLFLTQVQAVPAAECSTERLTDGVNVQRKWCLDPHPVNVYCLFSLFAENWPCQLPRSWTRGLHVGQLTALCGPSRPNVSRSLQLLGTPSWRGEVGRVRVSLAQIGSSHYRRSCLWWLPWSFGLGVLAAVVSGEICRAGLGRSPPLSGICT